MLLNRLFTQQNWPFIIPSACRSSLSLPDLAADAGLPASVVAAVLATFAALRGSAVTEPSGDESWQPSELSHSFGIEIASTDGNGVLLESAAFPHPWSMFKVSGSGGGVGDYLLLAQTLGLTDDADPVEDVLFLRDPMAAMAWAVEQKLQGGLDVAVDVFEGYLARLRAEAAGTPPPRVDPASAGGA